MALASLAAVLLLYGVMEDNHSTRVIIAKHAQVDNVRIDPDRLPVAMAQYPATVIGRTSDGQSVRCTIRSLHDVDSLTCVIPSSRLPISKPQVRAQAADSAAPATREGDSATSARGDVRVPRAPRVRAVRPATPGPAKDDPITRTPPVVVPPVDSQVPADHDPSGRDGGDDGDERGDRHDGDVQREPDRRDLQDGRSAKGQLAVTRSGTVGVAPVSLRRGSATCDGRSERSLGHGLKLVTNPADDRSRPVFDRNTMGSKRPCS